MSTVTVPNRPFATELYTGLMLPDGIFEASLGNQQLNAHFVNTGAAAINTRIYVEGASHPAIVVSPNTYTLATMPSGSATILSWDVDVSGAPAGTHYISFVAEDAMGISRSIKKIFVTRVLFNPTTKVFTAQTPEGTLSAHFNDFVGPAGRRCCPPDQPDKEDFLRTLRSAFRGHDPNFNFCLDGYLPRSVDLSITPTPPYAGQFGDLPFQDPWWKIILCIIAVLLLIGAAIAEAVDGSGSITVSGGSGGGPNDPPNCCGVSASGGGTSYVAAGLVAAAAAVATVAAASDVRDPVRRGQENTVPAAGELTVREDLKLAIHYPEPVAPGRPFKAGLTWDYTRHTTGGAYTHSASDTQTNVHIASNYVITAPNVVRSYRGEPFIIKGQFFAADGTQFSGDQLFVQCILVGPQGQYRRFLMQDDGIGPDATAGDGTYTGIYSFSREKEEQGIWLIYVLAQDVNTAQTNLTPEQAAQIIGGMLLTHQVTIDFGGGTCSHVPDGEVNVL